MSEIAIVDWVIVAVVLISTLISLKRGFVKEALSLVTLVVAVLVARIFGAQMSMLLVDTIDVPSIRLGVAYGGLFVVTLIVGAMVNYLVSHLVEITGLAGTDMFLGMLFGFARGVLIVVVIVGVMAYLPVQEDQWWIDSLLIPRLSAAATWLQDILFSNFGDLYQQAAVTLEQTICAA